MIVYDSDSECKYNSLRCVSVIIMRFSCMYIRCDLGDVFDSNWRAITDQVENSAASKGWRSLDLTQSPGPQANGGLARPLYRTQRSSSVPVQQNPTPNALNSETHSQPSQPVPPVKVRLACLTQHCHFLSIYISLRHHLLVSLF